MINKIYNKVYQKLSNQLLKLKRKQKKTIDEKQDKLIEQLEKNQKALTSGLEDIAMLTYQPETQPQSQ